MPSEPDALSAVNIASVGAVPIPVVVKCCGQGRKKMLQDTVQRRCAGDKEGDLIEEKLEEQDPPFDPSKDDAPGAPEDEIVEHVRAPWPGMTGVTS